jgi:hypothetical protein
VATLNDLKDPAHRDLAERWIKPELLARLSKAELRLRVKSAKAILDRASDLPQESFLALHQHARRILRAEPVAEYREELVRRSVLAQNAPSQVRPEFDAMYERHRSANEYPPGLLQAVEQTLSQKPVLDPELAAVAEAAIAHAKVAA